MYRVVRLLPLAPVKTTRAIGIGVACALAATALRGVVGLIVPDGLFFIFLFPAVMIAGLWGGSLAGNYRVFYRRIADGVFLDSACLQFQHFDRRTLAAHYLLGFPLY